MTIIGLTGASGSGKSTFAKLLAQKGVCVVDADIAARQVVYPGSPCLSELVSVFGGGILNADGSLDRKRLGKIAFSSRENTDLLNSVTHKFINEHIKRRIDEYEKCGERCVLLDASQLFESGIDKICDVTAAVIADRSLRMRRIIERDRIDESAANARLNAAHSDDFFKSHVDYVIYNNGEYDDFQKKANDFYKQIILGENIT